MEKPAKTIEDLAKQERNAYFRQWRSRNKEKVKKHNASYWERRAERNAQANNKGE